MESPWHWVEQQAHDNMTTFSLRVLITLVAIGLIVLAWTIKSKWGLAGELAYILLP